MIPSSGIIYGLCFLAVVIAFAFAVYLHLWVKKQPVKNETIIRVSGLIKAGANTFMRKEYQILAIFAGVAAVLIFLFLSLLHMTTHLGTGHGLEGTEATENLEEFCLIQKHLFLFFLLQKYYNQIVRNT